MTVKVRGALDDNTKVKHEGFSLRELGSGDFGVSLNRWLFESMKKTKAMYVEIKSRLIVT